jgi:hypothetical protein
MFYHKGNRDLEIVSGVLQSYLERTKAQAMKNEWKVGGSGFALQEGNPVQTAEEILSSVHSKVCCMGFSPDQVFVYSLQIDSSSGIYSRKSLSDSAEGIVVADRNYRYSDFSIAPNGDFILCVEFAGQTHLALLKKGENDLRLLTEGESVELSPMWSPSEKDVVYFSSAGLEILSSDEAEESLSASSMPAFLMAIQTGQHLNNRATSPFSISKINLKNGQITELISDPAFSFQKPFPMPDGSFYYLKKPYQTDTNSSPKKKAIGCLGAPFKLIKAIIGFFNLFTIKYSGQNLTSGGSSKVKQKDERQIRLEGNLISAEKELLENQKEGDSYPGIVPRSFELRIRYPSGEDRLIKKGVICYRPDGDSLLVSNGSYILRINKEGKEEKICQADRVTYLYTV